MSGTGGDRAGGPPAWVVKAASLWVPREQRTRWTAEWLAELAGEARRPDVGATRLTRAALGAFPDALTVRRLARGAGSRESDGPHSAHGGAEGLSALAREVRLAGRRLSRTPGFTVVAATTLGLGIAASTAIFAVVDSVLLSPLDYPDAERIVSLHHTVPGLGPDTEWGLSVAGYFHFRERLQGVEEMGAVQLRPLTLDGGERPQRVEAAVVTASLPRVFGARAALGRLFADEESAPDGPRVAVLSHGLWTRSFGQDPGVLGATVRVEGAPFEVVGVMEAGVGLPDQPVDLWLPNRLDPNAPAVNSHFLEAYGRLAPDATPEGVQAEMARLVARLPEVFPEAYTADFLENYGFGASVPTVRSKVVGGVEQRLWLVFGGVGLVLLIACANVANLFLVRTEGRGREVAVRSALGSSRRSILRSFLAESVLLAGAAAALGVAGALSTVRLVSALAPTNLPRVGDISLGAEAVVFAVALSLVAGVAFGLFPLLRHTPDGIAPALRDGGRGVAGKAGRSRVRQGLVVGQVAMALVLLAASGLMLRSFVALRAVDAGFDPTGVQAVDVSLPMALYSDARQVSDLYEAILTRLEAFPEVSAAGAATQLPLTGPLGCWTIATEEPVAMTDDDARCPPVVFVTAGFFEAMGIPMLEGRSYEHADNREQRGTAVVSQALTRRFWPDGGALDRGIRIYDDEPPYHRVVGVAADVRALGLDRSPPPMAYFPMLTLPDSWQWDPPRLMTVVIRTGLSDPGSLMPGVRAVVSELAPEAALSSPRTLESVVARSMARTSFTLVLLAVAAGVALLLGAVGIYGVISHAVAQRRGEVGLRMALGAPAGRVGRMVVGQSLSLVALGIGAGLLLALGLGAVMRGILYGVAAFDPLTVVSVCGLLLVVAGVASYLPAARAARIDPAVALRSD